MRHRGAEVGHFFLAEKVDGQAFTDEDEEVLELFASQAASAIANARTHHNERRARAAGYAPLVTGEAQDLVQVIRSERPKLVLLDLMLPDADGIELMQEVRKHFDLPVIFISGYGRDETVARALDSGAADYLVKPFSSAELVARVRATLRRHERPEPFVLGDLAIDYGRRRVTVGGSAVALTATEYELLRVLSLDAEGVVPYDTLLNRMWSGRSGAGANLVRIAVKNLRRKLGEDAASTAYIFSERGVGSRMPDPAER